MLDWKAKAAILTCTFLAIALVTFRGSRAVPSFARQTNLPCTSCHSVFPELNTFGRLFKIHGYTLSSDESVQARDKEGRTSLELPKPSPVSAVVATSFSHLSSPASGSLNNNVDFPQEFGLFVAAKVAPEVGAFVQATYEDTEGEFALDMVDIRYAHQTTLRSRDFVMGLTLNNNPTVQDVWDTVPMWSFPFDSSPATPSPIAAPLIDGGFDMQTLGLGPYFLWNNRVYGEISFYRSAPQGGPNPPDAASEMTISNTAPYWRVAFQHQKASRYFEIGTYGISAKLLPTGVSGQTDNYTDFAVDAQYEQKLSNAIISAHAYWIGENQKLKATFAGGGSDHETVKLNTVRVNGNFYPGRHLAFSLGYFATFGDTDSTLYSPVETYGSREGKPDTNGLVAELGFLPWLNTKLALQYVMYSRFNGAGDNYDGFGRDASDNNTLYLSTTLAL